MGPGWTLVLLFTSNQSNKAGRRRREGFCALPSPHRSMMPYGFFSVSGRSLSFLVSRKCQIRKHATRSAAIRNSFAMGRILKYSTDTHVTIAIRPIRDATGLPPSILGSQSPRPLPVLTKLPSSFSRRSVLRQNEIFACPVSLQTDTLPSPEASILRRRVSGRPEQNHSEFLATYISLSAS
jgi:hypothetical protein